MMSSYFLSWRFIMHSPGIEVLLLVNGVNWISLGIRSKIIGLVFIWANIVTISVSISIFISISVFMVVQRIHLSFFRKIKDIFHVRQ